MSWSHHVESTCSKAKRILGLLYRRFYGNTDGATLLQLYQSLVRPHIEYASEVWDPFTNKNQKKLEDIQKFACKIATARWDTGYQELLELTGIPSLATRRLHLKLSTLYKIVYALCYFPGDTFIPGANFSQRTSHSLSFHQPYMLALTLFIILLCLTLFPYGIPYPGLLCRPHHFLYFRVI